MFTVFYSLLLVSVVAGHSPLQPRQNSTTSPQAVYANFPSFGSSKDITGVLVFENMGAEGVHISSSGATALHSFPAGLGPFAYHGKSHQNIRLMEFTYFPFQPTDLATLQVHISILSE